MPSGCMTLQSLEGLEHLDILLPLLHLSVPQRLALPFHALGHNRCTRLKAWVMLSAARLDLPALDSVLGRRRDLVFVGSRYQQWMLGGAPCKALQ